MKQGILVEPGKIEIKEVAVPEPSEGEIVIKVNTALTCGTDLKAYIHGHKLIPMPGPFGHEYSGTVARAGKGVKGFKKGDTVMGVHSAPCNNCRYCKKGFHNLCEVIMEKKVLGAFSEYLLLPSLVVKQNLFHKPENIGFEEAALLEPFSCVIHPYSKLMNNPPRYESIPTSPPFKKGGMGGLRDEVETALVMGAGPIGLMHLAFLKMKGIRVIVSDFLDTRLSLATNMGADRVMVPDDVEKSLKKITNDFGVDLVIECTGQKSAWEKAVNYVRRGGTVVLFGGCPSGTEVSYDSHRLHYDELTLIGSFHYTPQDVRIAYHTLIEKTIDLSLLLSGEFPLKDIEQAFTLLEEGKGIKYALKP